MQPLGAPALGVLSARHVCADERVDVQQDVARGAGLGASCVRLSAEHALARRRLAIMWQGRADFERVRGRLSNTPGVPTLEEVTRSIESIPALQQQLALMRLSDSQLRLAEGMHASCLPHASSMSATPSEGDGRAHDGDARERGQRYATRRLR